MNVRRSGVCFLALLFITLASPNVPAQTARGVATSTAAAAEKAVQSFFRFHIARDKSFTRENIVRRRRWLTPELYRLLLDEYHREELLSEKYRDEVVFMEGDPFTDTQEHPDAFRVGRAVSRGSWAAVPVTFFLNRHLVRRVRIELSKRGRVWLIHNILSDDGEDLLKLLRVRLQKTS